MFVNEMYPELQTRWARVQEKMKEKGADSCILTDSANLFYLTGRVFNGYAYLPVQGEPAFFVRRPLGLEKGNIQYIRKTEEIASYLKKKPSKIGLESDTLSYNEFNRLAAVFPESEYENASSIMREARAVKTPYEIDLIRQSGVRHAAVYDHIFSFFQEGMTDDEVSVELEYYARKLGNLGIFRIFGKSMELFMGNILAGDNADNPSPYDFAMGGEGMNPCLPVGANGTMLHPGMTLMIDMNGNFTGYMTDMTRVFSVHQLRSDLAKRAHQLSIDIQEAIKQKGRPGVAVKDLYDLAISMVKENNLEAYFMGHKQQAGFIGHGVGIEVNELPVIAPRSKHILEKGMVFALEPKFVIPEIGAVGIENTFAVTDDGLEQLTKFPEAIQEL